MLINKYWLILPLLLSVNACTLVQLTEEGEKVRVLDADEVKKCLLKGQTTASVTEKVGGIRRHDNVILEELRIVARNAANNLDGDTIVAAGDEVAGKQVFKIYRCVPR